LSTSARSRRLYSKIKRFELFCPRCGGEDEMVGTLKFCLHMGAMLPPSSGKQGRSLQSSLRRWQLRCAALLRVIRTFYTSSLGRSLPLRPDADRSVARHADADGCGLAMVDTHTAADRARRQQRRILRRHACGERGRLQRCGTSIVQLSTGSRTRKAHSLRLVVCECRKSSPTSCKITSELDNSFELRGRACTVP
jgi:hypothetical protein